jgi:hypothetical protein
MDWFWQTWGDFSQLSDCGKIYRKFRVFLCKICGHVSIYVKLRFVEKMPGSRVNYHKITWEVARSREMSSNCLRGDLNKCSYVKFERASINYRSSGCVIIYFLINLGCCNIDTLLAILQNLRVFSWNGVRGGPRKLFLAKFEIELWAPQIKMCVSHLMWVSREYLMNPCGSRTWVPPKHIVGPAWTIFLVSG